MLTEIYNSLMAYLAQAGLTAYAEGAVPQEARFPFVTCRVEAPASLQETGCVVLTGWVRSDKAHADRLLMADRLISMVPEGGLVLPLEGGVAMVFRSGEHAVTWPVSGSALGACVRFGLRAAGRCS